MSPLYISLNENESSFFVSKFHLVCFIQIEARGLNHTSQIRKRLSCWNFYELWASRFTGGQTFFASVTRKAPFISSFVFNPRILLDDNFCPLLCPIRWRHEKSVTGTDSSPNRFHFSSLTYLHLLVAYYWKHAKWSLEKWTRLL